VNDPRLNNRKTLSGYADHTDLVGGYLAGIGRYDLLTADEEVELAQTMETGRDASRRLASGDLSEPSETQRLRRLVRQGEAARRRFIESNLRLVVSNARRYAGGDVEMIDLIQEGNLGLMTAVEKFDWRKGFKFSTYATWWIRQAMQRGRVDLSGSIRLPAKLHDQIPIVKATAETLKATLRRAPTIEEIAEESGVDEADVEKALSVGSTVAIETPIGEDGATLADFIEDITAPRPETEVESMLASDALGAGLASLSPSHRRLIELRFGLDDGRPATFAHMAEVLDLPEHRMSGMVQEALEALRETIASQEDLLAA
jgi:RNA polymerase sigma factor (sigma-70 family)